MRRFMTGLVLAALVVVPMLGQAQDKPALTPQEIASAAVVTAETSLQKALEILAAAQKAADLAVANLDKAAADLKVAEASGDQEKIDAAKAALAQAKLDKQDTASKLTVITDLVDRLKVILANVKAAADQVAKAATPEDAQAAANDAQEQAAKAGRILKAIEEAAAAKPSRIETLGVTVPSTTTSTTQPSPTPVGNRG